MAMKWFFAAFALVAVMAPATSEARQPGHSYSHHGNSEYYTAKSGHRVSRPV
jgi:ABC-type oligopeptide transport system substrate-binding subunit